MTKLTERKQAQLLAVAITVGAAVAGAAMPRAFPFGAISLAAPAPGVVLEGFSGAEPFGRWTEGERARLRFEQSLPRRFTVKFRAHAFVGNADKSCVVRVGGRSASRLMLTPDDEDYSVAVESPWFASDIEFIVSNPTSPKRLGLGDDPRRLGIAFSRIEIVP